MNVPHAFLDIETTGLDPVLHEPLEVAYILGPEDIEVHYSLHFHLARASEKALEINGWGRRPFPQVWTHFYAIERLRQDLAGRVMIGSNIQFDLGFLAEFIRRESIEHHRETPWNYRLVDLRVMAGAALGLEPPWPTGELLRLLELESPERIPGVGGDDGEGYHSALFDARWNKLWYERIVERCNLVGLCGVCGRRLDPEHDLKIEECDKLANAEELP